MHYCSAQSSPSREDASLQNHQYSEHITEEYMNLKHLSLPLLKTLALVLVFGISLSQAQEVAARRLSLEDAVRLAMKRNPELISARLEVQRSDARVLEAWGNALPAVDLSGQYVHLVDKPVTFFPDFFLYSFL